MNFRLVILAAIFGCCAPVLCQDSSAFGGYVLGFTLDEGASSLRPLLGIPGAAVQGAPLDAGIAITQAFVSPQQNYAVAITDGGPVLLSLNSATDPPSVIPLGLDASAASLVALSPDGSAAAFYSATDSQLRIATGLPGTPAVSRTVPTTAITGTIRLLAVSNDGKALIVVADSAGSSAITLLDSYGNPQIIANSSHVSAVQFVGSTDDLLAADDMDDTVYLIHDVAGSPSPALIGGAGDGIAGPVGVNVSTDQNSIVVANARNGTIVVLDPNGTRHDRFPCPCTPVGLNRLKGISVFLLNDLSSGGALWIFDGDHATPRVLFIPGGGQ